MPYRGLELILNPGGDVAVGKPQNVMSKKQRCKELQAKIDAAKKKLKKVDFEYDNAEAATGFYAGLAQVTNDRDRVRRLGAKTDQLKVQRTELYNELQRLKKEFKEASCSKRSALHRFWRYLSGV